MTNEDLQNLLDKLVENVHRIEWRPSASGGFVPAAPKLREFLNTEIRIKPTPRTVNVSYFEGKPVAVTEATVCWSPDGYTVHKFREVIE